jgi:hypothetical protein
MPISTSGSISIDDITKEFNSAFTSFSSGSITNGGFDFKLGNADQVGRGNSGESRALVKDDGNVLAINFSGDFVGGTRIDGASVTTGALAASSVSTGNIISSTTISTGTLRATNMNATSISTGTLVASTGMTGGNSLFTNINTTNVTSSNMVATNVSTGSLSASGTVTATTYTGASMQLSGEISTGSVSATNVNVANITATAITSGILNASSITATGIITNGGFDFKLGNADQVTRGNSGDSRALVKHDGNVLVINFNGDFAGGTRIDGASVTTGALAASSVSTGNIISSTTISTGTLRATNMNATSITTGTLVGSLSTSLIPGTGISGSSYNGSTARTWNVSLSSISPGTGISGSSYNGSTAQTWNINTASTSVAGIVQLSTSTSSTSTTLAATSSAVKSANDAANSANTNANGRVSKSGDTISGALTVSTGITTANLHATTNLTVPFGGGLSITEHTNPDMIRSIFANSRDQTRLFAPGNDGDGDKARLTIQSDGFVGINNTAPGAALDVFGTIKQGIGSSSTLGSLRVGSSTSYSLSYGFLNDSGGTGAASGTNLYAVYAETRVAATEFNAYSDSRIKKDVLDADDLSALQTLRQIQPKKYNYIDHRTKGEQPVWGFIAQQVGDVLDYSTGIVNEFIPNVYSLADVSLHSDGKCKITLSSGSTSIFTTENATDNKIKVRLILDDNGNDRKEVFVVDILSATEFTIEESIDVAQVFVFGQEVNDFHTLNKDAIFTVSVAALQEVDRQLQESKAEVANLNSQLADITARLDAAGI